MSIITLSRFIEHHKDEEFDCLIIGGGITGAALAYEASSRGYSVALVEKDDFGGATSAATGKLIHGGLRYLKQFEIGLVRESLRERRILSNIAPNFIYPYPIILPNTGWIEKIGLFVYDLLSFDRNFVRDKSKRIPGFKILSQKEIKGSIPSSEEKKIRNAILYYDCLSISPERLTLTFIKSAAVYGAKVSNYTEVKNLTIQENRVLGAEVLDKLTGKIVKLRAKVTINATGAWTQKLLNTSKETEGPTPKTRSEGIYLITRKLSDQMFLYVGGKSHFSFAPWRNHSLIGPTDTPYQGDVSEWKISAESVENFLSAINSTANLKENLTKKDVLFVYGGLRPLAETNLEDTYTASRRSEFHDHEEDNIKGLITAAGGKYTTSREFARNIFENIIKKVNKHPKPSISHKKYLYACDIPNIEEFISRKKRSRSDIGENTIDYLIRHYGLEYETILDLAYNSPELGIQANDDGEIFAQVVFAIRNEMALTLKDIFFRRTGMGALGHPGCKVIDQVAKLAASELGWTKDKLSEELASIEEAFKIP
ncbi:glycerol-3-phosphate dehydrogenase/oxidase [Leptospira sarikeiensis]|uniref:Glycerol-3-phosphate dehydrogenase/oxidase n=1 Tax=Leptospira sarikeiensis TaxID=2484943 RepID=A0A4R9KB85_9LEPT|nr:glycerol-3-phosphate dehydrogenase/oxidase [Leptospira sarikeiensis]TGL62073.1 glycerol-3-phosphate dehydrogenase/oxidase [Leptospira sarikeiensis]